MRKLIVLSESEDYDVGGLVRFLIKMFDREDIKDIFYENGFEIITSNRIKRDFGIEDLPQIKIEQEFIKKANENYSEYMIFGIHPYGVHQSFDYPNEIKKIGWLNDPHYLANFTERNGEKVQDFSKKFNPEILKKIDYLITPSPIYFKNLNITEYDEKLKYLFYFLDEDLYPKTGNIDYSDRLEKIVLSGCVGDGYLSRIEFDKLRSKEVFKDLIYKIDHPGYQNNKHMTELNYYDELTKYKAAFVGHYKPPIDFLLAKHIEVLMCGCLGFFEPNPLLEIELGLIEFEHYVPCCDENGEVIKDESFYIKWMNSEEGKRISEKGKEYVRNRFGKKYIKEFIDLLKKIG